MTSQTVYYGYNRKENKRKSLRKFICRNMQYFVVKVLFSCDILDHLINEIRSNKARITLLLDESTDVSNYTCLLVYSRRINTVEWKD